MARPVGADAMSGRVTPPGIWTPGEGSSRTDSARYLLAELDHCVAEGRKAEILDAVADALDPLFSLIVAAGGPHRGDGERTFAMFHLASRSISDLAASAHLASHTYLQQAYGAMRPVHENCDLLELFAREPGEAARWIQADEPGKLFRPGEVRKRLGSAEDKVSEYGHLSEMGSHPRFAGSRLTGLMKVAREDPSNRVAVLRMGPFFPEHPASVFVYMFLFQTIIRLGFNLRHLMQVSQSLTRKAWSDAYLQSVTAVAHGCRLIRKALVEMDAGDGSEFLDTLYDPLMANLQPDSATPIGDDYANDSRT